MEGLLDEPTAKSDATGRRRLVDHVDILDRAFAHLGDRCGQCRGQCHECVTAGKPSLNHRREHRQHTFFRTVGVLGVMAARKELDLDPRSCGRDPSAAPIESARRAASPCGTESVACTTSCISMIGMAPFLKATNGTLPWHRTTSVAPCRRAPLCGRLPAGLAWRGGPLRVNSHYSTVTMMFRVSCPAVRNSISESCRTTGARSRRVGSPTCAISS